jgi:N-acetylneuraminate synthase/N,N'-diacetyllegionaminate synthase
VKIGQRPIGPGQRPYVIAELGVNHDGELGRALELVDAAADAGADAIKLQHFEAGLLMSKASRLAAYQRDAGEVDPLAMLRRLELPIEDMARVIDRAHARGVHAIVTVFSVELVPVAQTLAWDAYKTASPDLIHRPLLDALAGTGKPLILSTGAATIQEVERTLGWLGGAADRLAVLQCVSSYPTPTECAELCGMAAIAEHFDGPVGYSDHTPEVRTAADAVVRGACILEKHLTYDVRAAGPDHAASLDPERFALYRGLADEALPGQVNLRARDLPAAMGEDPSWFRGKRVLTIEEDVRKVSRQSVVSRRDIAPGETITRDDLTFKRPGTGVPPYRVDEVIGRRAARGIAADMPIVEADLG